MTEGDIRHISDQVGDIREQLGRMGGELSGIKDLMLAQKELDLARNEFANKQWDEIKAEIRNDKHATRQVEQKLELLGAAQLRTSEKVDDVSEKISGEGGIEERLSGLEKLTQRAIGYILAIATMGSIIGYVITHYSGQLLKLLVGKP